MGHLERDKPKWLFILNPIAGGGRALRSWPAVAAELQTQGVKYDVVHTQRPGHALELAAAHCRSYGRIVAVGGDGTCQEVVRGLVQAGAQADTALGVLPLGTGNDFARGLGLPTEPRQALRALLAAEVHQVDLARVNGRPFINVAGIGFDAEVAALLNRNRDRIPFRVPGPALYLAGILYELIRYRNAPLSLTWETGELAQKALLVAVGNGRCYAGGLQMCPHAEMDDGAFDVVVAGDLHRLHVLRLLPTLFSGEHLKDPQVKLFRCRHLRVEGPPHLSIHADGEVIGQLPAEFTLEKSALAVLRPVVWAARSAPVQTAETRSQVSLFCL